jgi:hypothetical protein
MRLHRYAARCRDFVLVAGRMAVLGSAQQSRCVGTLSCSCIVHDGGFPDAMFPAVYNANFRIVQAPGIVAIGYELIHDTRIIPLNDNRPPLSPAVRTYMGDARGRWEGTTLVVETTYSVSGDIRRSGDVDRALDGGARPQGAAG